MKKDFFDESLVLTSRMREEYFKTNDYLEKGKYRMKLKYFPGGKQHYDFDMNSQEYLLEELDKVAFEPPEVQEHFLEHISQLLEEDMNTNQRVSTLSEKIAEECQVEATGNPRNARETLARHFHCRIVHLQHKRHLTLLRFHNHVETTEHTLKLLQARLNLIDMEIQSCLTRKNRLRAEDFFEESFGVSKPTAVNEDKQPVYRALEEEECRFSNIMRDDVEIYLRNQGHQENVLTDYWRLHYQMKYLALRNPLAIMEAVQVKLLGYSTANKQYAQKLVNRIFRSVGFGATDNQHPPDEVATFFYRLYGVENAEPLVLPLHSNMRAQLLESIAKPLGKFFRELTITTDNFSALLPKLTNFVAILFKYQNKDVALEPTEMKLGLDDEIDLKKELCALLEQTWVRKHVALTYEIYDRRLELADSRWPKHTNHTTSKPKSTVVDDYECQTIIGYLNINDYQIWRKYLKETSLRVVERAADKFMHCYSCRIHQMSTKEQLNLQYLNELYHVGDPIKEEHTEGLRHQIVDYLKEIVKGRLITNPVEVETRLSIFAVHTRETRRRIRNLLNAGRCYFKRLAHDMRTFSLLPKEYEFDDNFILDSKKEDLDDFESMLRKHPTMQSSNPALTAPISSKKSLGLDREPQAPITRQIYHYDRIVKKSSGETDVEEPMVVGYDSNKLILYDITLKDLKEVEDRLLQTASKFINDFEGYLKLKGLPELVDRHELLSDLYECQLNYQKQKFELLEVLMLIYDNTVDPADCYKLSSYIFEVMNRAPVFDSAEPYFQQSYQAASECVTKEKTVLFQAWQQLVNREVHEVNSFHKRLAKTIRVPYHRYGVIYGDLEPAGKMNRTNSLASLKSSRSGSQHDSGGKSPVRLRKKSSEIIEVDEDVDFSGMSDSGLDEIANYDEYLLTRDLDQIFDEIARDDPNLQPKQNQNVLKEQVSTETNVVHRRFEGGPHFLGRSRESLLPTYGSQKVEFFNFFEYGHWVTNLPTLLRENQEDMYERYGFCSELYQSELLNCLMEEGIRIIAHPDPHPKCIRNQYHWDDNYMLVIKNLSFYKEVMKDNIDPPSLSTMALHHALPKHIDSIPMFAQLQHLDIHQLECLLELKKPANIVNYRELMLALNLIDVFRFDRMLRHAALKRKQLSKAYKTLGKELGVQIKKYVSEYQRINDSAFLAVQQLKISGTSDLFGFGIKGLPQSVLFPDSVTELKAYVFCERANTANFQTFVKLERRKYTTLLRLERELSFALKHKSFYRNERLDRSKIDVLDESNTKMLCNRLKSLLGTKAMAFRQSTYLRSKANLKTMFERKHIQTTAVIYDKTADDKPTKMINDKKSKLILIRLVELYGRDLMRTAQERSVTIELLSYTRALKRQVKALPFPHELWRFPTFHHFLEEKFYFDQKNRRTDVPAFEQVFDPVSLKVKNPLYIYSEEQIFDELIPVEFVTDLEQYDPAKYATVVSEYRPPSNKDELIKWFFRQSDKGFTGYQAKSYRYLQRLNKPLVGGCNKFEESCFKIPLQAHTNNFLQLLDHYRKLEQYLQAQLIVMSFSGINVSLIRELISRHKNFEETYSLASMEKVDQRNSQPNRQMLAQLIRIRQTELYQRLDQNSIRMLYVFDDKQPDLLKQTKKAIETAYKVHEHNKEIGNFDKELIRAHNTIAVDEAAEFLMQRVQGLGLVREAFLPFVEQLRLLSTTMIARGESNVVDLRLQNIYRCLYISLYELYRNWPGGEGELTRLYNHWFYPHSVGNMKIDEAKCYPLNQNPFINSDESEKYVYSRRLEKPKKDLMFRLRCALLTLPVDLNKYLWSLARNVTQKPSQYRSSKHVSCTGYLRLEEFAKRSLEMVDEWKQADRLRMLARLKFTNQLVLEFLQLKGVKPQDMLKSEQLKQDYLRLLVRSNMYTTTLVYFDKQVFLPLPTSEYSEYYFELQNHIESTAVSILNNFEQYSEKLQLTRAERQLMHSPLSLQDRENSVEKHYHHRLIRQVICIKLLREELKCRLLRSNIDVLCAERLPSNEPKRNLIINPGLIPRVKLNSCFSSPLVVDRKNYISQQYKLSFVQAFINRLRNKVSRVDLLSSGYGFVITVSDLEDCVNFLNKSLFTFTEKEFKYRLDTFGQYCEMFVGALQHKNREIVRLDGLLTVAKTALRNVNETVYIEKVNNLLVQNQLLKQKVQTIEENSKGMEDRVRKAVNLEYEARVSELTTQNQLLKKKFKQFQNIMTTLTKSEARNSFLELVNQLRVKSSDLLERTVDFGLLIPKQTEYNEEQPLQVRVKEHEAYDSSVPLRNEIGQESIQKCKIGEDIIHDPYYVTKLINKMRAFNVMKLAAFRSREEITNLRLNKELTMLNNVHDATVVQTRKELVMREELARVQQDLASRSLELESYKLRCDVLQGENEKLRIELLSKEKKLEQRAAAETGFLPEIHRPRDQSEDKDMRLPKTQQKKNFLNQTYQRIKARERTRLKMLEASQLRFLAQTEPLIDEGALQLSNKELTWQEKCQELYSQNRGLQRQMEQLKQQLQSYRSGKTVEYQEVVGPRPKPHSVLSETDKGRSSDVSTERRRRLNIGYKYKAVSRDHSDSNN